MEQESVIKSQAERIIAKFGGQSALAAALTKAERRLTRPSTIQQWEKYGYVPGRHWKRVICAARTVGVTLEPVDFIADLIEWLETVDQLDHHKKQPQQIHVSEKELEGAA